MTQVFRVFFKDGSHVDIDADAYTREGESWALYDGFDIKNAAKVSHYPTSNVNAITLVKSILPIVAGGREAQR